MVIEAFFMLELTLVGDPPTKTILYSNMIVMLFTHSVGNERGQYAPVVTLNLFQGLNNMMDTETSSV
jgi:hypothetical protein